MSRIGAFRKWHYAESIFPTFNELGSEAHLMVNVSVTRMANFCYLGKILTGFGQFLRTYLVFGKIVILQRYILMPLGKFSLFYKAKY